MRSITLAAALAALTSVSAEAAPLTWSGNGHSYEIVWGAFTWDEARRSAETMRHGGESGYLATVTSVGEWDFLTSSFNPSRFDLWLGGSDALDPTSGTETGAETDQIWRWVTGPEAGLVFWDNGPVTGVFNAMDRNEPNNYRDREDHLAGWSWGSDEAWNDMPFSHSAVKGFVVEYGGLARGPIGGPGSSPVPVPAGLPLIAGGLGALAMLRRLAGRG